LGFHPYVEGPFITCTVEEIVQKHQKNVLYLIFLSPKLNLPLDFSRLWAGFKIPLSYRRALGKLVLAELKI